MKKSAILAFLCGAALATTAAARTWTSSDGAKTFEGEFVSLSGDLVTVKRANGRETTFKLELLSEEDRTFAKEQAEKAVTDSQRTDVIGFAKEQARATSGQVAKELAGKMVKTSGKRLSRIKPEEEKSPDFYFVYFAASW